MTFVSVAMMLNWLDEGHQIAAPAEGAEMLQSAVEDTFAVRALQPVKCGSAQDFKAAVTAIAELRAAKLAARHPARVTVLGSRGG